jgi:hypothetical protein
MTTVAKQEKLFYDEGRLQAATILLARSKYEARWGRLNSANEQTLDVTAWKKAWEVGRRVEKRAGRHIAAVHDAVCFVEACKTDRPPMGPNTQLLVDLGPALLRLLDKIDDKRAIGGSVNQAEEATRSAWIRQRLRIYYGTGKSLKDAPRQELAVLGLIGGWWEPKHSGLRDGMTPESALAHEADLMARARKEVLANGI